MSRISLHDEWPAIPGARFRHASTVIMSVLAPRDLCGPSPARNPLAAFRW